MSSRRAASPPRPAWEIIEWVILSRPGAVSFDVLKAACSSRGVKGTSVWAGAWMAFWMTSWRDCRRRVSRSWTSLGRLLVAARSLNQQFLALTVKTAVAEPVSTKTPEPKLEAAVKPTA